MEINRQNYETAFLLYIDRELDAPGRAAVEKFLRDHPDLQKEFDGLAQTVQVAEPMIFPGKKDLYRKEEPKRVFPLFRVAAAASVAVLLAGGWWLAGNIKKAETPEKISVPTATVTEKNNKSGDNRTEHPATAQNITEERKDIEKSGKVRKATGGALLVKNTKSASSSQTSMDKQQANETEVITSEQAETPDMAKKQTVVGLQDAGEPKTPDAPILIASIPPQQEIIDKAESIPPATTDAYYADNAGDNAISVFAVNDKNKTISGIFNRLTGRSATKEDKSRKLRVSVIQISY